MTNKIEALTPNQVLMNSLNKLDHVLVVGIDSQTKKIHIETSNPTYMFVNYILNRALFNINYLETNAQINIEAEKTALAEANVANTVRENIAAEIEAVQPKRGRPKKVI